MSEPRSWNRPTLVFAYACVGLAVAATIGLLVDDRELGGAPVWAKPLKFAISGAVYGLTWSWLTSLITRKQRTVRRASVVVVALLTVELVIIVGQAARGRFSHFNFATVPDAILYEIMAVSIIVVWCGNLVLTLLVLRSDIQDRARKLTVGLGAVISLVGIGLGALMTLPSGAQIDALQAGHGVALGAHTVGAPDGGPGLPLLGWSTTGGDLRIPHFVGMHALQALLLWHVIVDRVPRLRPARAELVWIGATGFTGLLALLTWQAYRGQPLVSPDAWTLSALGVLLVGMVVAAVRALTRPRPLATVTWIGEPVETSKAA
jgi:hypothetical protein